MAVEYDNSGVIAAGGAVTTLTLTFSVGAVSNRVLYACIAWNNDPGAITAGPTYASVAMSEIEDVSSSTSMVTRIYRLIAPATGSNSLTVSWTNARACVISAISVKGANQTAPDGTETEEASGDESISVASTVDGLIIDFIALAGATDVTASAPLTELTAATSVSVVRIEAAYTAGTGSNVTCAWSSTATGNAHWGMCVLSNAQALTQDLASSLTLSDEITGLRNLVQSVASSLSFTEQLQAPHTDLSLETEDFTDPTELGEEVEWEDQDLAPSLASPTWTHSVLTAVTWTQADADHSGTPLTPVECADTLSDMFCDRDYPDLTLNPPTGCDVFPAVSVTAGGIGRLNLHSVEEIPDSSLVIGVAAPSSAPHDTVAMIEASTPYATATKQTLEATNPQTTEAIGRMNPFTQGFVVAYPFIDGSDRLVRYKSIPWDGSAYTYGSVTTDDVDIPNSGDGSDFRSIGLVPLKDGRWLFAYCDVTSDKLYYNFSEDDGETWSAFSSQSIGEGISTFQLLTCDGYPVIAYADETAGTPELYLRLYLPASGTWTSATNVGITLVGNQGFSLAAIFDAKRFAVVYNETGNQIVKIKYYSFTFDGTITAGDTETIVNLSPSTWAGNWATYHPVATDGAKWVVVTNTTGGDVRIHRRLDEDGVAWSSAAVATAIGAVFMLPAVPRCAASLPMFNWTTGNSVTLRRLAS